MKILKKYKRFFACSLLFIRPFHITADPKTYGIKTENRITYTCYDPKKPAQTITIHKYTSGIKPFYSGVQRKGSCPAVAIKPGHAHDLFLRFAKECGATHTITDS